MAYTFFWWAVFSSSENLTFTNASRSNAPTPPAEAFPAPPRVFLALPLIDISLPFFPRVFLIIFSPVFLRGVVAFFAGVFLELGVFGVFLVAGADLADKAFLAPALAAFLEAAEFGAAMF